MDDQENNSSSESGFFLWLVIIALIGFFVWASIPNFVRSGSSPANACINNLRQIDAAANEFALEHNKTNGDAINFPNDITNYIKLNKYGEIPPCPSGGIYTLKKVGEQPTCSLSNAVPPHVLP